MIAYHIDRCNSLKEFSRLELKNDYSLESTFSKFNNSLSNHGIKYLTKNFFGSPSCGSYMWEIALEYIRALNFPNLPSRFQSIFACKTLQDTYYWKDLFQKQGFANLKIFEIDVSENNFFEGDSNWFNLKGLSQVIQTNKFENASLSSYLFFSHKYWSGEITSDPKMELSIKLPCKIGKLIS